MQSEATPSMRSILAQLRKTDTALAGKVKNQPVIVYRHRHWHMVGVGVVVDEQMVAVEGISTVSFMSPYRARRTIAEWWPYSRLVPFEEVCIGFSDELAAKVLPQAEDYRPLLRQGLVTVAGGFTTDTLRSATYNPAIEDRLVAAVEQMMAAGERGPFLHFNRAF